MKHGLPKLIYFVLLLLASECCYGQKQAIDSLERLLSVAAKDTNKVNLANELGVRYKNVDNDVAIRYAREAIALAEQLHFSKGVTYAYRTMGYVYQNEGKYKEALSNDSMGMKIAESAGLKIDVASFISMSGEVYQNTGVFDKALDCHFRALKIREAINDKKGTTKSLNNICVVYMYLGKYPESLDYGFKSLKLREEIGDRRGIASSYQNIGIVYMQMVNNTEALRYYHKSLDVYKELNDMKSAGSLLMNMGSVYVELKDMKKGLETYLEGVSLLKEAGDANGLATGYANVGNIYRLTDKYKDAEHYFSLSLEIVKQQDNKYVLADLYNCLGEMSARQGKTKDAFAYLQKGQQLAIETKSREWLRENYQHYSDLYSDLNDYKNAYKYRLLYDGLKDSIWNEDNMKEMAEMRAKFETEKKEKEIVQLNKIKEEQQLTLVAKSLIIQKRNLLIVLIVGAFLIIAVLAGFGYNNYKVKQKVKLAAAIAEQEKIRLSTTLETEQRERVRIAKDMHDELGSGISKIIIYNEHGKKFINGNEALNKTLYSIDNTVKELVSNMNDLIWSLQIEHSSVETLFTKIREFATDFLDDSPITPVVNIPADITDEVIAKDAMRDIFLSVKEALNNAVKYSGAKTIHISAAVNARRLTIGIADDGVGMDLQHLAKRGNGLKNMQARVSRNMGTLKLESTPGHGTTLLFMFDLDKISQA